MSAKGSAKESAQKNAQKNARKNAQKEVYVVSPFEIPDVSLALSAEGIGAFPILHLGRDRAGGEAAVEELSARIGGEFGVCFAGSAGEPGETFGGLKLPERVTKAIAPYGADLSKIRFACKNAEFLWQVHSAQEAGQAIADGAAAIVIKGNEGAGRVAAESSFIIFQKIAKLCRNGKARLYIQGGAGVHTSAAYLALGAAGVVLDSQVALLPECGAPKKLKDALSKLSGSETAVFGDFRALVWPNSPKLPRGAGYRELKPLLGGYELSEGYLPVGQDVAFSIDYLERYKTLDNLVFAIREAAYGHLRQARALKAMSGGSAICGPLGTRLPIAQGPMARISDEPKFIEKVADGGALPFLALSTRRGESARALLRETAELMGDRPWGVGILGFAFPQLVEEQTRLVLEAKPRAVLIAGGRADQAKPFEKEGIAVFLHAPAIGIMDMFLKSGARSFIFEGRESGGHVGPLLSAVLWERQINRLLNEDDKSSLSLLFAGGVHDAFSAAFVSVMTAPLAASAAKVGVIAGTAYLATKEIVQTGAITKAYRDLIVERGETVLLKTAIGQETRALHTPFVTFFGEEKQRLREQGVDSKDALLRLEELNMGRLRMASRGEERRGDEIVGLTPREQFENGLYMTGEVAGLLEKPTTIAKLHSAMTDGCAALLDSLADAPKPDATALRAYQPCDIAIIGMSGIFPFARDVDEYWKNILFARDCIIETPDSRWSKEMFFSQGERDTDFTVSKWGGFIEPTDFDAFEFGTAPQSLTSIEPVQLLSLLAAKRALEDA
ncbi:MAG: nitronate monooxygenase, partial [Clostridiales bacterium]|nr:nitronate monooxygenase [Clostridiales bacterium]